MADKKYIDLEDEFKTTTGKNVYVPNFLQPKIYSSYYVIWLETKLNLHNKKEYCEICNEPIVIFTGKLCDNESCIRYK